MSDWAGPPQSSDTPRRPTDGFDALLTKLTELKRGLRDLPSGLLKQAGISISPEGMTIDSNLTVDGDASFSGDTEVGGDLAVRDGGGISIESDGRFEAYAPPELGNRSAVVVGRIRDGSDPTETQGYGLLVQRPSGEDIISVRSNAAGSAHRFKVDDNEGTPVIQFTEATSRGIDSPSLEVHMAPQQYEAWPGTSSSSWETLYEGYIILWHPRIYAIARSATGDATTTGQIRFMVERNGSTWQIGSDESAGYDYTWHSFSGAMPAGVPIRAHCYLRLQARRTSGSGDVRAAVIGASLRGWS